MAGGTGTRFWPASRTGIPKQMLRLVGDSTMLQSTRERLLGLVSAEQTLVMTSKHLIDMVREQLPDIPPEHIVGEPSKRDTAACIALAASMIQRADPAAVMLVLPADHVINTAAQFHDCIRSGMQLIEQPAEPLQTFGIRPTYAPNPGYVRGEPLSDTQVAGSPGGLVSRKAESSDRRAVFATGNYYEGIFVAADTILNALRRFVG